MNAETRTAPDLLAVLAEPNRRRLLELLRGGERTVSELAAQFSVTRPAVSQHLGVLAAAGLVEVRQDGRFRRYRVDPDGMAALRNTLDAFWTVELEDLAAAAPATAREHERREAQHERREVQGKGGPDDH
jgi:DNA-binding transcriptional ArsR family regulator